MNLDQKSSLSERCQFYSGDWSSYISKTENENQTFDFILTSETIYNIQNYEKIINVLTTKLKPNGICYLAAKSHYFGVGGSVRSFESVLLSKCKQFQSETVFLTKENVSREILKISFKKSWIKEIFSLEYIEHICLFHLDRRKTIATPSTECSLIQNLKQWQLKYFVDR